MDPLSDVLSLLKPRNHLSAGFAAGGDWAVQFPDQQEGIKTGAVVAGRCWLAVDGVADTMRLEAGDFFLLPHGRSFRLASDLAVPPVEAARIFSPARTGGIATWNGGGDFLLVSSRFALAGDHAALLLGLLPPVVLLRDEPDQPALRWAVERTMQELREPQPGGFLVIEHLAHMMLVHALRRHLQDGSGQGQGGPGGGVGWLFALGDRRMAAAIGALHADPARRWTVEALARQVGMSRSTFAQTFRRMVGTSPLDYLTRWRMRLAADRLARSREPVAAVALSLGYESESAFATAFKRVMGCPPRRYGRAGGMARDRLTRRGRRPA